MKYLATICASMLIITSAFAASGPFVGHVESDSGIIWYRADTAGTYRVKMAVTNAPGVVVSQNDQTTDTNVDYTIHFALTNLSAETGYQYEIFKVDGGETSVAGGTSNFVLTTWPATQDGSVVVIGMGSGARSPDSDNVWPRIKQEKCEAFILLGDTPYINNTDLTVQRNAYRGFADVTNMADLYQSCVMWGTWDDHDFGINNSNGGDTPGKTNSRIAFLEYRANPSYGENDLAVYTRFQAGGAEIFLLDDRWFSQTEPSPVDTNEPTCFGADQWQWLLDGLTNSTAKFKLLTFGQIWEDKKNAETDDMGTYWYERNALFDFIREHQIPGVVLIGGDIHVSRHLIRRNRVGYDLHEFVTSPMHNGTIASLDVYNPHLEWSALQRNTFLKLTVDCQTSPATLTGEYIKQDGTRIRTVTLTEDDLEPPPPLTGLENGLRGYWRFESSATNQTVLGDYLDATAVNGAQTSIAGGILGNCASLDRSTDQYFYIPHTVLEEDANAYTFSVWMKSAVMPSGADRWFLGETTLEDHVSNDAGYAISVGLREGTSTNNTKIQLYTHTLDGEAEGGYDYDASDTSLSEDWHHVAVTYDGDRLRLYLDGSLTANHDVVNDGTLTETGGFVLGGHREGTGRNFNGLLDECGIWERALTAAEVSTLYNGGTGVVIDASTAAPEPTPVRVYLLGGQSNMQGVGRNSKLPAELTEISEVMLYHSDNVHSSGGANTLITARPCGYTSDYFGPEIGFAAVLRDNNTSSNAIALIKHAYGGTSLEMDWPPGTNNSDTANWGPQYTKFVNTVSNGLAALVDAGYEPEIYGMIWQQGEQDAKDGLNVDESDTSADDYGTNLTHFIERVREQFGADTAPGGLRFVLGQVLPYAPVGGAVLSTSPGRNLVRQFELDVDEDSGAALSMNNTATVPVNSANHHVHEQVIDGFRDTDEVHLDATAQLNLGRSMAYEMLEIDPPVTVRAARVHMSGTTYIVTNETAGFNVSLPIYNKGDHQLFFDTIPPQQADGIIIGSANDGGDSIFQVGGELTWPTHYANGVAFSTADLSGGGEKDFDFAFAHFPFAQGWIAAHVDTNGTVMAGPNLPNGTTITALSTNTWRGPGNFTVHIPNVDSRTDGMLFVVGAENDANVTVAGFFEDADDVNIVAGDATLGDWHIHIRDASENDSSGTGEDGSFSFLYLPYDTINLIGGRIEDTGVVTTLKSVGTFTASDGATNGQVNISIPKPSGGFLSDQDGILILTVSAIIDGITGDPVDGNALSWTYDDVDEEFVVHAFDAPDGNAQNVRDFVFAFVPYENSLQLYQRGTVVFIK